MYCKHCGNKVDKNDKYCNKCGQIIKEEQTTTNINNTEKSDNPSLILAILALFTIFMPGVSIILSITSLILGSKYKKDTGKNSRGKILAIISLILTILFTLFITFIILCSLFLHNNNSSNNIINDFYNEFRDKDLDIDNIFDIKNGYFSVNDGTYIEFNSNGNYKRYKNNKDKSKNYYSGTYQVYNGIEAVRYISNLDNDLSISEEEQFRRFKDEDLDDYYLIVLDCDYEYINGEQKENNKINYYYGFSDDNYLKMEDIESSKIIIFKLENTNNTKNNNDIV